LKIYDDIHSVNTDYINELINKIIGAYNQILANDFAFDGNFTSICIQAIYKIGLRAKVCIKNLEGLLSKKILSKIKVETLNTIEKLNPNNL